jgi:hypothetical protein
MSEYIFENPTKQLNFSTLPSRRLAPLVLGQVAVRERQLRQLARRLNWLALAPIGTELAAMPAEQIERRLVPVVAGAFQGAGAVPER